MNYRFEYGKRKKTIDGKDLARGSKWLSHKNKSIENCLRQPRRLEGNNSESQRILGVGVYRSRPRWDICGGRWPGGVFQTQRSGRARDQVLGFLEGWFPSLRGDRCSLVFLWRLDRAFVAVTTAAASHPVSLEATVRYFVQTSNNLNVSSDWF